MNRFNLLFGLLLLMVSSCNRNESNSTDCEDLILNDSRAINLANATSNEKHLMKFASVLSKATYENRAVREFLKNESVKQFDKNYDVLYYLVHDKLIGDKSFRDILVSYSSEETIQEIEVNVPLLNILVPKVAFFDILPEDLDIEDKEIPVAISKRTTTSLFLNGQLEVDLRKEEIPDFHVFVVNENDRVIAPETNALSHKSGGVIQVQFKSPNFDGSTFQSEPTLKSVTTDVSSVGKRTIDAFTYFYADDESINQKAFQRDYVYYGITPQDQKGNLIYSITEYINYIEIDPKAYFKITETATGKLSGHDPCINRINASQKSRELSEEELLGRLWTKGAYDFKFEVITTATPLVVIIPLLPQDIWNFNIEHSRKHATMFRHSKNTYTIDPNKFTSKKVFLETKVNLSKWNIMHDPLYKYVKIYEMDDGERITEVVDYETPYAYANNFSRMNKIGVGLKVKDTENEFSSKVSEATAEQKFTTITINRYKDSDSLGWVRLYYYDPLIDDISADGKCELHTYDTGLVKFGITAQ